MRFPDLIVEVDDIKRRLEATERYVTRLLAEITEIRKNLDKALAKVETTK